jgi:hypothetical protein
MKNKQQKEKKRRKQEKENISSSNNLEKITRKKARVQENINDLGKLQLKNKIQRENSSCSWLDLGTFHGGDA